ARRKPRSLPRRWPPPKKSPRKLRLRRRVNFSTISTREWFKAIHVFFMRLIALVFVLLLFCGCSTVRRPETPHGPYFRIATYNVNRGSDPKEIAEVIRRENADIVCLQKADEFEDALRPLLSKDYSTIQF